MRFMLAVFVLISLFAAILAAGNPVCSLPKDVGPCRAGKPRFFYNTATKQCERFMYGGCQGNENNFETIDACKAACSN
ncbi:unnamed protein product [Hermetia illucens]|uniref:BPTI/Kunitz inhibitor domain-containing protein n=1 Tax=Hermetia illucens TaxID=343691 RepID=A0A7R8YRU1_HERIL|nr:hemolymph trypsin inhibitor B-like [Hermetia illucens]CAD7079844.1 unnamed protein product [Hermetia illucens]